MESFGKIVLGLKSKIKQNKKERTHTQRTPRKLAPATGQADTKGLKVKWKSSLKE